MPTRRDRQLMPACAQTSGWNCDLYRFSPQSYRVMVRLNRSCGRSDPCARSVSTKTWVSRSHAGAPVAIDCTAAVAAACPIMNAADCERIDPCTLVSLEWQRPATHRFSEFSGTRML